MQYRTFGRIDLSPSALGFGAMRLPVLKDKKGTPDMGAIDEPAATAMLQYALDHGVNYVDTAYVYHEGASEPWLGRALREIADRRYGRERDAPARLRERVKVATKLPVWKVEGPADFDRLLEEQLDRLGLPNIDFYLLHSLDAHHWEAVVRHDMLASAERALSDGRISHLGFSFHDEYALFERIVDATDLWSFCQIQYNYMDEGSQAGRRGLEYASGKGLGVIVMEPVRGGMLARPPEQVAALWAGARRRRAPADWALQWVWDQPEVSFLLSGMSTMEQVKENVASAEGSRVGLLEADELELIGRVRDVYRALAPVPCTDCKYCLPCPNGVAIPDIFEIYNDGVMYKEGRLTRMYYDWLDEGARADACTRCGECEPKCPQKIAVADELERARAFVESA
jgi:predicted aldo/keto reductase-like oxidoreductase